MVIGQSAIEVGIYRQQEDRGVMLVSPGRFFYG
jgi:hypothetical protein